MFLYEDKFSECLNLPLLFSTQFLQTQASVPTAAGRLNTQMQTAHMRGAHRRGLQVQLGRMVNLENHDHAPARTHSKTPISCSTGALSRNPAFRLHL